MLLIVFSVVNGDNRNGFGGIFRFYNNEAFIVLEVFVKLKEGGDDGNSVSDSSEYGRFLSVVLAFFVLPC